MLVPYLDKTVISVDKLDIFAGSILQSGVSCNRQTLVTLTYIDNVILVFH